MTAASISKSASQGTAQPPAYGVPDCQQWLAERKRIRALPLWRRLLRRF